MLALAFRYVSECLEAAMASLLGMRMVLLWKMVYGRLNLNRSLLLYIYS